MGNGFRIIRDETRCICCYECIIVCPQSVKGMANPVLKYPSDSGMPPELGVLKNCIQCMTCWDLCRAQAIRFENHHEVARLVENEAIQAKIAKII